MAVQIVSPARYLETIRVDMDFRYADDPNAGISVCLTLDGEPVSWTIYAVDEDVPNQAPSPYVGQGQPLCDTAAEALRAALDGERGLYLYEVWVHQGRDEDYAIGRCPCGGRVDLVDFYDNPCSKCNRTYAKQGWEMAPPWQRGEEIAYGMEDEALEVERFESAYLEGV